MDSADKWMFTILLIVGCLMWMWHESGRRERRLEARYRKRFYKERETERMQHDGPSQS